MSDYSPYYSDLNSRAFRGAPEIKNASDSINMPLSMVILKKIKYIRLPVILWGKNYIDGSLVEDIDRQYEFALHGDDQFFMHLYIKDESKFFKTQGNMKLLWGGAWQRIRLDFKTINGMTIEEQRIIWSDFD